MKVGTDGVLLGAWAGREMEGSRGFKGFQELNLLDIGTGTGLIALMMAQRCSTQMVDCHIDAVEIDTKAAQQAAENVAASPWANQIQVYPCSLSQYMDNRKEDRLQYDLVVSNPPFYNATLKPDDEARAIARHKDALPLTEIIQCACRTLTPRGRLALIYPMNYDSEVMTEAIAAGLKPLRICNVLTKVGKACKRRMVEFCLNHAETLSMECEVSTLSIRDAEGNYTSEYLDLTLPFYTHLH